jgi:hypothetical protein
MNFRTGSIIGLLAIALGSALAAEPVASETPPTAQVTQEPDTASVATRSAALDLAGAFANDGYKVRDGYWTQIITPEASAIVEVNLFAGNEYWFSASAAPQAPQKIAVTVFDRAGRIVDQQRFDEGFRGAAGFEPTSSGQFYVRVQLMEGAPTPITLVYSYK